MFKHAPYRYARVPPAVLAAALMLGAPGSLLAADAVVVASSAPGYTLGQVVADGAAVTLPEGASALFLFATGRTVRVKGPYDGRLDSLPEAAAGVAPSGMLGGGLLGGERFAQADLGATRALAVPAAGDAERAFTIDPAVPGTVCVATGTAPRLQRPRDPALAAVSLAASPDGRPVAVAWTDGAPAAPWPRGLEARDGAAVAVTGPDGRPLGTLRLRAVEGAGGAPALAVRLAAAGCGRQAAALLAPMRDALAPLDVYLATDRGANPAYRAGEAYRLVLQTNRDAHVYCFLRTARGQLVPIFPSAASKTALVEGGARLDMPGERMPMPLNATGDTEVRCLAAEHDLGADLGADLPGSDEAFRPLGADTAARLDRALDTLRDGDVVMAQVILRVR